MPLHSLAKFEMQKYCQNESRFNGVYSSDDLLKRIKDEAYAINLDKYADFGTHWIALYEANIGIICFDSLGVKHVSKEIEKFLGQKNIKKYLEYNQTSQ